MVALCFLIGLKPYHPIDTHMQIYKEFDKQGNLLKTLKTGKGAIKPPKTPYLKYHLTKS